MAASVLLAADGPGSDLDGARPEPDRTRNTRAEDYAIPPNSLKHANPPAKDIDRDATLYAKSELCEAHPNAEVNICWQGRRGPKSAWAR